MLWDAINNIVTSRSEYEPGLHAILARRVGGLIERYPSKNQNGTVRALKIMYCATGGKIDVDSQQPETSVEARELHDLPDNKRLEYIQELYKVLHGRFSVKQRGLIQGYLSRNFGFRVLMEGLGEELNALDALPIPGN